MKELSVYKAEILRRSNERIAERRKRRNRLLAFCIPTLLVVGMWSVMILPAMMPAGSEDFYAEEENVTEGTDTENSVLNVKIETLDLTDDFFREYSEAEQAKNLYERIESYLLSDEAFAENEEYESAPEGVIDSAKALKCRITFTLCDGSEKSYLLYKNTLCDEANSRTVALNEEDVNALNTALGFNE